MKYKQWCLLGLFLIGACTLSGNAVEAYEVIEPLANGHINWTRGFLVVKGCEGDDVPAPGSLRETAPVRVTAAQNLFASFNFVRMDARRSVADIIALNVGLQNKIEQMVSAAPVINQVRISEGCLETAVQFQLTGGFAQLVLPGTIEQVQSIKAINGAAGGTESDIDPPPGPNTAVNQDIYTGLVIDARGIGAKPSLVPMIMDENLQDVYSPAFISREFAVRQGVCGYARQMCDEVMPRVGPNPMLIKGLRILSGRPSDIVISDADASRLRSASSHLRFLRQCRVVIILD
jgi:hypothetical protein